VPGSAQQRMDLVAQSAQKVVATQLAIRLHVPDHRLNRATPSQLPFHLRRQATFAAADENLRHSQLVATVAAIYKSPLDRLAGDPFHLRDRPGQGVAVVGVARFGLHAQDKVVTVGHRHTYLDPKFELLVRLAFADALHLGRVQAVELVLVLPLLVEG